MMSYSLLASFCLLGMASSQTISSLTACLTKEQNVTMECKFTKPESTNPKCTYKVDNKIVASSESAISPDSSFKGRATASIVDDVCVLKLSGYAEQLPKTFDCTIQQATTATKAQTVEKSTGTCSAGNTLKHGGVILLLAFVLPLLSGML